MPFFTDGSAKFSDEAAEAYSKLTREFAGNLPQGFSFNIQPLTEVPEAKWVAVCTVVGFGNSFTVEVLERMAMSIAAELKIDYAAAPHFDRLKQFLNDVRKLPRTDGAMPPPAGNA